MHPGGRRFTCPTNQVYRRLSLIIASEMAKTFAETPGVIGWQIDNEFTLGSSQRCYCNYCQAGFQNLASLQVRHAGQPESELGNSFLEPDLHRFQPDPGAAAVGRRSESGTGPRLRPLPVLRQRFLPARTAGHAAQDVSAAFRYDQQCRPGGHDQHARPLREAGFHCLRQLSRLFRHADGAARQDWDLPPSFRPPSPWDTTSRAA